MAEIKVLKTHLPGLQVLTTESEKRAKYAAWKTKSSIEGFLWDTWLAMELNTAEPKHLSKSNIMSVQVKSLLKYSLPLFEGNPNTASRIDKPGAIWMQYDKDLKALDLSFHEYRIPKDEKFRIAGLQLWWRKNGGSTAPYSELHRNMLQILDQTEVLASDSWSFWHPDGTIMGAHLTPYPFNDRDTKIMLTPTLVAEDLDVFIDEINQSNLWFMKNESLLYETSHAPLLTLALPIKWPEHLATTDTIARRIQPFVPVSFTGQNRPVLLADINQKDLIDLYQRAQILPAASPIVIKQLAKLSAIFQSDKLEMKHRFDSQTLKKNETLKNVISEQVAKKEFKNLTTAERTQVMKLYERKHKPVDDKDAQRFIKTIHRAFDAAITDCFEMQRVYEEFKRQTEYQKDASHAVQFKTGKGELCPHYVQQIRETIKSPKNALGQIDTQSVTQSLVKNWAEKVAVNFKYYCKHCGELLMTEDLEDFIIFNQTIISSTSEKDPLWYYIMSEVNQIIRRVKFAKPPDPKILVQSISVLLEPEINTIQLEMQKSKTKNLDDIRNIMIIYISSYCFALLSKMIIDQPKMLRWNVHVAGTEHPKRGGKVAPKQTDALKTLSIAYGLLVDSNQNRISKIKDFSIEQIKPILLRGYEWARNVKFATSKTVEDKVGNEWVTSLVNDPWYNLLYDVASIQGPVGYTDFTKILGVADPKDMLCTLKPFEKVLRPVSKDYYYQSYINAIEYVDKQIFLEIAIPRSLILVSWKKDCEVLMAIDIVRDRQLRDIALRPSKQLYNNTKGQIPTFQVLDISFVKCVTGERHKFGLDDTIFVFQDAKKKTHKLSLKEYLKLEQAVKQTYTLKDELCGRCGVSSKTTKTINIQKSLDEDIAKHNFFQYFANRCPLIDDLHDFPVDKQNFVGASECKRCAFSKTFLVTQPDSYYKKYHDKIPNKKIDPMSLEPDRTLYIPQKQEKWNVTLTSILQIANVSSIPYNLWINLGLSEHKNFSQLKLGKINPQSTIGDAAGVARLSKLINNVNWVHKQYLLVKNHTRVVLPLALKLMLEDETQIVQSNQNLAILMPDILRDFNSKLDYYKYNQPAKITCNYVLHTLCSVLLSIRAMDKIKKLAHKLFEYLCAQLISYEQMVSELEIVRTVIAQTDKKDDSLELDDDTFLEMGEQRDSDENGTEDPFSLEDADIETSNMGLEDEEFMD